MGIHVCNPSIREVSLRPAWAIWDTRSPKQGRWIKSINYIINYISSWFSIPFEKSVCLAHTCVQHPDMWEKRKTSYCIITHCLFPSRERQGLESQDMSLEWGWQSANHSVPPVSTSGHPPTVMTFQVYGTKAGFYMGSWDANSESHACTASDFTHGAISPAPSILIK